ncbi:LPXTG cell wall anchor domain-containing protein [Lactobacillus sp. LC28-10]|uniref:LPXTG cell wall anchor domain-containing protein n=1 Tax=Secundilactobacillus angelensis TaxID=2722706 RepID=A0ABX1L1X0_9LACO|nr:LPXTG cell wall anchor domain-containing protein [Secundilactobacillus angelensis]MCH5463039.1 LPXTG cell wall anchor domain-containing protein [Secundilactobacillus angelensis]NLR19505.1 LPXTG cell wall anchor domain-containing protein [Secundilactobacillus angelensis]
MANMNGGVVKQLTGFVTNAVTEISTLAGNIGTKLIGNGQSLINSQGLNIASVTQALNSLLSSAQELSNVDASDKQALENYSGPGVSSIVATLVQILGAVGVNTEPFNEAYQASMAMTNANIKEMNRYGDALMKTTADDGTKGVNEEMLMPATIGDDGKGNQVISMKTPAGFSTWNAILNMVNSYITGWTAGIGKALDGVFTGEQPIDAPTSPTYVTVKDNKGNDIQYDVSKINGQKPQDILRADYDDSGLGRTPLIGSGGWTIVTSILNALSAANNKLIQPAISAISSTLTNGIGNIGSDVISGNLGAMKAEAAIPISWTDPSFITKNDDGTVDTTKSAIPGQFIAETFDSNMNLFNQTQSGSTTIAYQNVDKTQLRDLISKVDPADQGSAQFKFASDAVSNPNASQYDVDRAVLALAPDAKIATDTSTTTESTVGNAALTTLTNSTAQDVSDAATALQDAKDYLATKLGSVLHITPAQDASADDVAALASVKPTFTADDFDVTAAENDATNTKFNYALNDAGNKVLSDAVTAADKGATVTAPAPSTITLTPKKATTTTPTGDITYTVTPVDNSSKPLASPISHTDGVAGANISTDKLQLTYTDANNTVWYMPKNLTSYHVPALGGNINVKYTDTDPNATTTPTGDTATYTLDAIDESGTVLPNSTVADQKGNAGDPIDASGLKATYNDANGKTWYKPSADSLSSYFIKDGAKINVLYTDKDTTTQPGGDNQGTGNPTEVGNGSFVINGDGTITFTDKNGKTLTIDPKKLGTPIVINNNNTNTNTNNNDGSKGTGSTGTDTTGTDGGSTNGPVTIVLPGQDGKDAGTKVSKGSDGSLTFTFPDGSTQTVKPGDNQTKTDPNGGSFKVNPDGTVTFTDGAGNSYTVDPNNKTTGTTQPGSTITNITLPGKDSDGKNTGDQTLLIEKTPSGQIVLHLPDGSTQTVDKDNPANLPNGSKVTVNPDGSVTITDPDGKTTTIDPNKGQTTPENTNNGGQTTATPVDTDGDGIPDSFEIKVGTNPDNVDTDGDGDTDFQEILNGTNPKDPNSNLKTLENGGKGTQGGVTIINNYGNGSTGTGSTTGTDNGGSSDKPVTIVLPGSDGTKDTGVTVGKGSDGSLTFTFPDGSTQTVKPGDTSSHTNPEGGSFVVNPDGTITFTDPSGKTYTYNPNDKAAQPVDKTTVVVIPGQNGTDGKDTPDTLVTVQKGSDGTTTITLPDGTVKQVNPGDTGKLPDGTTYLVNPNGTITFTGTDGKTYTVDPDKGTPNNVTINTNGGGTTGDNTGNAKDTDGDGIPDNLENVLGTNPSNKDTDGDGDSDLQEIMNGTNPKDPNSNLKSVENGGSTGSTTNNGGATNQPITINLPGQNGGTTVTKNPDGSLTFNFPDGSKDTVKPGDTSTHNTPAGGTFVVNPDGSVTFTNPDGSKTTIDPNKIGGQPTASDSKTTVIVIPGKAGTDGKPGTNSIVTVEKTSDGSTILHMPDGTTKEVKPGDKGDIPGGGSYVVNDDGTITFTNPDGTKSTIDPKDGTQGNVTINPNGGNTQGAGKTTVVFVPNKDGNGGITVNVTKNPDGSLTITNPDGSSQTVKPGQDGKLPNGATFVVNPDGSLTITNPDGSHFTIDPNKGAAGSSNGGNTNINSGNTTTNNYYGSEGPASTTITLPAGKDGTTPTITYTKNPDGTFTLVLPDGSKDVKPGETGTLPNGGTYTVNKDGSLTITNPDGTKTTVNPGNTTGGATNGGTTNYTTINNYYGKDGSASTIITLPAGKDGTTPTITYTKNPDGTFTLVLPDGSKTVKPGETGTLPNGGTYTVNKDGSLTITNPDGTKTTVNPADGATSSNGPVINNTTNNYYGKDGATSTTITIPGKDGATTTITYTKNPDGTYTIDSSDGSKAVKPGDTGKLPNGSSYTVNKDGSLTITNPDGSQFTVNPANSASTTNGGATNNTTNVTNNYYGSNGPSTATITLPAGSDGKTSTITYTKNPDGTYTIVLPDGSKSVQPGDTGKLPNGGSYVVNKDGSLTITNPDGSKTTVNPGNGSTTNNGGTTNNYYYGGSTTVTLPAGSDGKTSEITYTKNPDGTFTIVLPDGSKTVKPGDTGKLPNGGSYTVNKDGSLTITNPDGTKFTVNPGGSTSTTNNGGTTNNYTTNNITYNYGSNGSTGATITVPGGSDGSTTTTITYTKNPDGSYTLKTPDGSTTVKPGQTGTLPNGDTYVVNPDGSLSITNPNGGGSVVVNPGNGATVSTGNGNVTVNVNINNGNGGSTPATTVNTPNGNYTVTVNGNGTYDITTPDNNTVNNVKPGDSGTLPNGKGSYVVNDHNIVITEPDGSKLTVHFGGGDTTTPGDGTKTPGGDTTTPGDGTKTPGDGTTTPGDGTKTPDNGTTTPSNGTGTPATTDGGTDVTNTNTNTNTNNNGEGTSTSTSTTTGAGNGADQGNAVSNPADGNATSNGAAEGTTAEGATGNGGSDAAGNGSAASATAEGATAANATASSTGKTSEEGNGSATDKSALPQTDEQPAEGIAALGLLGGLVSLLGLAGASKRRKDL